MKIIWVILWIILISGVSLWVYKVSTMFSLQDTFWSDIAKENIKNTLDVTQSQANTLIISGRQYVESGVNTILLSWSALLEQKKLETQQYLLIQKQKLKLEAQAVVEAEAKKKIQWVFSGR